MYQYKSIKLVCKLYTKVSNALKKIVGLFNTLFIILTNIVHNNKF
jgi:hypothetical protein